MRLGRFHQCEARVVPTSLPLSGFAAVKWSEHKRVLAFVEDKSLGHDFVLPAALLAAGEHDPDREKGKTLSRVCKTKNDDSDPARGTNLPWLPADGGHHTDATAEELVASPRAHNLEAEGLVELALVLGAKEQAELCLAPSWDHPAETHQSEERDFV